ncbi:MAG TPA: hypothetical protein DCY94_02850 [Firmicutes bacterium]|nr:hypothetical protein [Bacillota bacterium]
MKRVEYLSIIILTLFMGIMNVNAAKTSCPTADRKKLATEASYVKVDYEIKDISETKTLQIGDETTTYKVPNYSFVISIYNITENLYVYATTTNATSKKTLTIYPKDAVDGIYTFIDTNISDIYNYTFSIRSNNPNCQGLAIRTMKFTKPRYNAYSEFTYCKNSSNFYCQRFIGTEINIKDTDDFLNRIKVNNENSNPNRDKIEEAKQLKTLLKKNWKLYLSIFIAIIVIAIALVYGIRIYRKKKGWRL